jgi:ferredoxin
MIPKYTVNETCIGCEACVEIAPDYFAMKGDLAYVKRQPDDDEGDNLCREALEACPVDAIEKE